MAKEENKEQQIDESQIHPIVKLLAGGCANVMGLLKEDGVEIPEDKDINYFMDALFAGIGQVSKRIGHALFVLSPEDQKILNTVHQIAAQHGGMDAVDMQVVVKPKKTTLVAADGSPITKDGPKIVKP